MQSILIVEDDVAIATGLEDDVTLEGHGVEVVSSGIERYRARRFR